MLRQTEFDLAVFSGEGGSSGPEKSVAVVRPLEIAKHSVTGAVTTVAKSVGVGDARPSEFVKCRATMAATVATSVDVGKARTLEIAKYGATTESELAEIYGGIVSWFRALSTTNADVTAVAKSAGEARLPGIAKHSAKTESEFAVSSVEESGGLFLVQNNWHDQRRRYSGRTVCW